MKYCADLEWFPPTENPRILGPIYRGSKRWKAAYGLRQSVERVFKSVKESLRLERHFIRGLRKIALHCLMSVLAFQLTALTRLKTRTARIAQVDGQASRVRGLDNVPK